jgi:hypothetical protein
LRRHHDDDHDHHNHGRAHDRGAYDDYGWTDDFN